MEEWSKVKYKYRAKQIVCTVKEKTIIIGKWCMQHPMETITIIGSAVAITGKICKAVNQHKIENRWYDPSTGMYFDLKHKPTNNQAYEAYIRHKNGEDYAHIYRDMGII